MAIPKNVGRDCELSATGVDSLGKCIESWKVTQEVLKYIDAAFEPHNQRTWTRHSTGLGAGIGRPAFGSPYSSDCLRHWAPNGMCCYSDLGHPEGCTAISLQPLQYASQCLSMLLVVEQARQRAQQLAEPGTKYLLSTANVDMLDPAISWGTHDNMAISIPLWEELFVDLRCPSVLGFVASSMAAAIPFFGSGYVMPMRDGGSVYSLSGRAAHITKITTLSTTEAFRRGLLNSRREPHAHGMERLHLIGFDYSLVCSALKCCFLQCCLAAAEEGFGGLGLYDPVRALHLWSWSLDLRTGQQPAAAVLADGREMTLPQYMREVTRQLLEMVEAKLITDQVAPGADRLLPRIIELTHYAEEGSIVRCARHLDWAVKLLHLLKLCQERGAVLGDWLTRLADHDFGNTDPQVGTFWQLWNDGLVDPLVEMSDVQACLQDGPAETRAWGRGRIIQQFFDDVADVDWSYVELFRSKSAWGSRLRINMPSPNSHNRASLESILNQASNVAELERLLSKHGTAAADLRDPLVDIRPQLATSHDPD